MLGLGLALSIAKKTLGDAIDGLLSALRGRATYYENSSASKSTIKAIDNADVLDKATILLTPTATSDARVHCVKPSLPDYGKNLIPNSDDADSWTIVTNSGTIVNENGYLKLTDTSGSYGYAYIPITVETGKDYIITYNLVDSGTTSSNYARIGNGVNQSTYHSENNFNNTGKRTVRISPTATTIYITLISGIGVSKYAYWTDVTVQATADFDFDRASSATRINSSGLVQDMQSITDPELVLNGDFEELGDDLTSPVNFLSWLESSVDSRTANTFTVGGSGRGVYFMLPENKTSKINVSGLTGSVEIRYRTTAGGAGTVLGSSDTDLYVTTTNATSNIYLRATDEGTVSVTDVSVQQVDPNDRWSLSGAATFEDGVLHFESGTNEYSYARQDISSLSANTYEIQLEIKNYVSGACQVGFTGVSPIFKNLNVTADGTYTAYISPNANGDDLEISRKFSGGNFNFDVEVVSVKDITFSTEVDLARINYDSNGDNGHILLEPTSTNLLPYSEDFSSYTLGSNSTLTYESDVVAPDGSLGVYRLQNPASSNTFLNLVNTTAQSISVWAKAVNSGTNNQFNFYNSSIYSDIQTASSEWQRFEYSWASSVGGTYYINNDGDTFASDIYIWGAQLEALPYATSYIPTYGSTVTRATETLTGSGNSTLINSTEGVLYAEIAALDDSSISIGICDGSTDNRVLILLQSNNTIRGFVESSDTIVFDEIYQVSSTLDYHKVAIKYKANDFALWIDGVERDTDTNGASPIGLNELLFNNGGGVAIFYGKCKALAVFNEALSDTELQNLTS